MSDGARERSTVPRLRTPSQTWHLTSCHQKEKLELSGVVATPETPGGNQFVVRAINMERERRKLAEPNPTSKRGHGTSSGGACGPH